MSGLWRPVAPFEICAELADPVARRARSRIAVSDWGSAGLSVYQTGRGPLRLGERRGSPGSLDQADDREGGGEVAGDTFALGRHLGLGSVTVHPVRAGSDYDHHGR